MRVSELVRGYGELRRSREAGRHALNEEAALTPIFHALNRGGGWRGRRQEPPGRRADEVDEFRRDPLTAPIPVQALAAAAVPSPSRPGTRRRTSHALSPDPAREPRREGGRHHYRLETAGARGW